MKKFKVSEPLWIKVLAVLLLPVTLPIILLTNYDNIWNDLKRD